MCFPKKDFQTSFNIITSAVLFTKKTLGNIFLLENFFFTGTHRCLVLINDSFC